MHREIAILVSFLGAGIILLNGFAAGLAAALYLWRGDWRRGRRTMTSLTGTGAVSALTIAGAMLEDDLEPALFVALAMVFAGGMVVAIPGAALMSRKIERVRSQVGQVFN